MRPTLTPPALAPLFGRNGPQTARERLLQTANRQLRETIDQAAAEVAALAADPAMTDVACWLACLEGLAPVVARLEVTNAQHRAHLVDAILPPRLRVVHHQLITNTDKAITALRAAYQEPAPAHDRT